MFDVNNDNMVCEKDLYWLLNNIKNNELHRILHQDIKIAF